ncbi:MAG: imidazolonepropionase [Phycisphaerales bacterium]|nr:imidazolonepropionase [Phycisphaerales bacterium]
MSIVIHNARLLTLAGDPDRRRGKATGDLGVIERGWLRVRNGRIADLGPGDAPEPTTQFEFAQRRIDARARVLMPAFIDCHTHLCWAGERLAEWEAKLRGATYLDILAAGGGILATVRAVRAATRAQLTDHLAERLAWLLREGTTTVEIKSGYGLDTETELKMLRAIASAARRWPGTVVPTACIGHAIDPECRTDLSREAFIRRTIDETLPAVTAEFPGIAIDAYCEEGAWTRADCERLFDRALAAGHPVRAHADQFNSLGLIPAAAARRYRSVDHLEATTPADLATLARSNTFAVILPCAGFHTDHRYADARALLDAGARLAIATNTNPGSAPCQSMPAAIALAARFCGLTPAEAIACATATPAALLDLPDRARLEPGRRADLILLRHRDERALAFEFGGNPVDLTLCNGEIVN